MVRRTLTTAACAALVAGLACLAAGCAVDGTPAAPGQPGVGVVGPSGQSRPGAKDDSGKNGLEPNAPAPAQAFDDPTDAIFFDTFVDGAVARDIGIAGMRAYWVFDDVGGGQGIAAGNLKTTLPYAEIIVPADDPITRFDVAAHVAYQTKDGPVGVIIGGGMTGADMVDSNTPCAALTTDPAFAYCRTADSIIAWRLFGEPPVTLYTGVPSGDDLVVDDHYLYVSTGDAILALPKAGGDLSSAVTLASGLSSVAHLAPGASQLYFSDSGVGAVSKSGGDASTVTSGADPSHVAPDPLRPAAWLAFDLPDGTTIEKASATGNHRALRTGLPKIGGLATDGEYVYWSTGRFVFRAPGF